MGRKLFPKLAKFWQNSSRRKPGIMEATTTTTTTTTTQKKTDDNDEQETRRVWGPPDLSDVAFRKIQDGKDDNDFRSYDEYDDDDDDDGDDDEIIDYDCSDDEKGLERGFRDYVSDDTDATIGERVRRVGAEYKTVRPSFPLSGESNLGRRNPGGVCFCYAMLSWMKWTQK